MKRFVSLLLAVIMVFSCFAVTTLAEEGTTEETTGGTGEVVPTPDVPEEDNSITV
ncbi:MAG: hypothetical protein J6L89_05640 [Clostridia bacterium]|nr:hypothetical protein [Clostridia bacterium]